MNDLDRNAALHRRINAAVADGSAREVPPDQRPTARSLTDRVVANRRAGRPLLDGLTVFRGAKDPDVDAGTFDSGFKHASPLADLAQGYAALANQKIGLVVPAAQGIGVLAEYALPPNARFVGNFGLEHDGRAAQALSVPEVEVRLAPLVDAYLDAPDATHQAEAQDALATFYRSTLYELAVPAGQAPLRRWVVQLDEEAGIDRLLEHPTHGPLAEVLVDVVRERKLAVDAHGPSHAVSELRRGGPAGLPTLDAFSPGVAQHLQQTAEHLDQVLQGLREQAYATPLTTLDEALAWRRQQQQGMRLARLTNSGMDLVFEHEHQGLRQAPEMRAALDAIDMAAYDTPRRADRAAILQALRDARRLAQEQGQHRQALDTAQQALTHAEEALATSRQHRTDGAERLDQAEQQHRQRRSKGLVATWWYRWNGERQALNDLAERREGLSLHDRRIERRSENVQEQRRQRDLHQAEHRAVLEQLRAHEQRLREQRKNGDLTFLGNDWQDRLRHDTPLTPDDWHGLAQAAHAGVRATDRRIVHGHRAAARMARWAEQGLAPHPPLNVRRPSLASTEPVDAPVAPGSPTATVIPLVDRARLAHRLDERLAAQAAEASPEGPATGVERPRRATVR